MANGPARGRHRPGEPAEPVGIGTREDGLPPGKIALSGFFHAGEKLLSRYERRGKVHGSCEKGKVVSHDCPWRKDCFPRTMAKKLDAFRNIQSKTGNNPRRDASLLSHVRRLGYERTRSYWNVSRRRHPDKRLERFDSGLIEDHSRFGKRPIKGFKSCIVGERFGCWRFRLSARPLSRSVLALRMGSHPRGRAPFRRLQHEEQSSGFIFPGVVPTLTLSAHPTRM